MSAMAITTTGYWPSPCSCICESLHRQGLSSGAWDVIALRDKLQVATNFCHLLRNQFTLLSPNLLDPKVEWSALDSEISKAEGQVVGKTRLVCHHKPSFMQQRCP
jgi:hypothetical protein